MFNNIPSEMKSYPQWLVYKLVPKENGKSDKIPLNAKTGFPASVTNPNDWCSFEDAVAAKANADGVGFVFTDADPFTGIDLDDTGGDAEAFARQAKIYEACDSYSELSPSGTGLHVIVKGRVPTGRRRANVEVYSAGRFFTMTGNVYRNTQIADRQQLLDVLYAEMGGGAQLLVKAPDRPETQSDAEIVAQAGAAANAAKFAALYRGEWSGLYPSQSEADQSLINIVGFYSKNQAQIARIFRASGLGQRDKANRPDYVGNMVRKALDRDHSAPGAVAFGDSFRAAQQAASNAPSANPVPGTFWTAAAPAAPLWHVPPPISYQEFYMASASPAAIVAGFYYADVGTLIAPGGTGKTTLILWQAIHITLGRELWGMPILKPGPVIILTAEDSREMLVARLRSICTELGLSQTDIQTVAGNVLISDVSGYGLKLTEVEHDVVRPAHTVIAQIVAACLIIAPVLVVIDPAVSFGVGESRVNDAEQGLVEAGRRLRGALNCCVLFVHHTGKANARDKTTDQYSGRGGSAFADGARMVHVLQNLGPADWSKETGTELEPGESGLILARPKISYARPQPPLFLRRSGYRFDYVDRTTVGKEAQAAANDTRIHEWLTRELAAGRYHSKNSVETADTGLKRPEVRAALNRLEAAGLIEMRDRPGQPQQRGARQYLHPVAHMMKSGP